LGLVWTLRPGGQETRIWIKDSNLQMFEKSNVFILDEQLLNFCSHKMQSSSIICSIEWQNFSQRTTFKMKTFLLFLVIMTALISIKGLGKVFYGISYLSCFNKFIVKCLESNKIIMFLFLIFKIKYNYLNCFQTYKICLFK